MRNKVRLIAILRRLAVHLGRQKGLKECCVARVAIKPFEATVMHPYYHNEGRYLCLLQQGLRGHGEMVQGTEKEDVIKNSCSHNDTPAEELHN